MKTRVSMLALSAAAGLAASANAQTLTPPNFTAQPGNVPVYSPAYTQVVSGTGSVVGFQLIANGMADGGAWNSDLRMELTSPSGHTLYIGGGSGGALPPGGVDWGGLPIIAGTPPATSGTPQAINVTYDYSQFGAVNGQWTVQFYNNYTAGTITWDSIQIVLIAGTTGACCLTTGSCIVTTESACTSQNGAYQGNNTDCASITCPAGACCLPDNSCIISTQAGCTAAGGVYSGNGTDCGTTVCNAPGVLFSNGPLLTAPAASCIPAGANSSILQTSLGLTTFGFGHQVSAGNRIADDFTVPSGGWTINEIDFYSYQTGSGVPTSTHNAVNFQIWDGPPGDPTSQVVFGDTTTNRLSSSTFSGLYRHLDTSCATDRPIYRNTASAGVTLPAGTYWLDWQTGGTLASGPWVPPVTVLGQTSKTGANGLQGLTGVWGPALDGSFQQDFPFVLRGPTTPSCYANCDGSTGTPALNVADFGCFLTKFAANDPYANCDGSTGTPQLNVADFGCFLTKFAAGCN